MTNREKVEQNMKETIAYFEAMSDEEFANNLFRFDNWYRPVFIETAIAMGYPRCQECPGQEIFNTNNQLLNWLQQESKR